MKTRIITIGLGVLMAAMMFTGCDRWHWVEGNYSVVTETRQLPEFETVKNEGNFDVYIIQDSLSEVTIEAESNLIPLIRTKVSGNNLEIDTKDNLRNNYPMKIYVHTTVVKSAKLSGSGLLHAEDITAGDIDLSLSGSGNIFFTGTANNLDCDISGSGSADIGVTATRVSGDISGSGDMELWGSADRGDFKISGSGSIRGYDMPFKDCYVTISGSGGVQVTVSDYLNVNISGSGDVYYMGSPSIETNISGSGNVIHP